MAGMSGTFATALNNANQLQTHVLDQQNAAVERAQESHTQALEAIRDLAKDAKTFSSFEAIDVPKAPQYDRIVPESEPVEEPEDVPDSPVTTIKLEAPPPPPPPFPIRDISPKEIKEFDACNAIGSFPEMPEPMAPLDFERAPEFPAIHRPGRPSRRM